MKATFLKMSKVDDDLIQDMRSTILYQHEVYKKREKLVYGIASNV